MKVFQNVKMTQQNKQLNIANISQRFTKLSKLVPNLKQIHTLFLKCVVT